MRRLDQKSDQKTCSENRTRRQDQKTGKELTGSACSIRRLYAMSVSEDCMRRLNEKTGSKVGSED